MGLCSSCLASLYDLTARKRPHTDTTRVSGYPQSNTRPTTGNDLDGDSIRGTDKVRIDCFKASIRSNESA